MYLEESKGVSDCLGLSSGVCCAPQGAVPEDGVEDDQKLAHAGGRRELFGFFSERSFRPDSPPVAETWACARYARVRLQSAASLGFAPHSTIELTYLSWLDLAMFLDRSG